VKKLDVPRDTEGGSGRGDLGATGGMGCSEESGLKLPEDLPGAGVRARMNPTGGKGGGELRGLGNPKGDAREAGGVSGGAVESKEDWEMVREAGTSGGVGAIVGGVVEDGGVSGDEGVGEKSGGNEEAIETGGAGVGGGRIRSEVEMGEGGVGNVRDGELGLERGPGVEKRGGGWREGASGVVAALDKVKVAAEEGVKGGVGAEHGADDAFLDVGLALTGFEVDVEKLEGLMGARGR
jgi:hypothetical protein